MKFINVTHSLNKSYNVEDSALLQAVTKSFVDIKDAKLDESKVIINKANTGFAVELEVTISKSESYVEVVKNIETKINEYSFNLIGSKPDNIQIIFKKES